MKKLALFSAMFLGMTVVGCGSDSDNNPDQSGFQDALASPVNVLEDIIPIGQALAQDPNSRPETYTDSKNSYTNLLYNGGFEDGLAGWTACGSEKLSISSDAYLDDSAASLEPGTCFYQSVPVEPGSEYSLSCFARITKGSDWTGLGMGFSDANWHPLEEPQPSLITSNTYQRYDVLAIAPANAKYASVWMYTDNDAVIDNCLLITGAQQPEPPSLATVELLDNSSFDLVNADGHPQDWSNPCGGEWKTDFSDPTSNSRVLSLGAGSCASQSFSASDIKLMNSGSEIDVTCEVLKPQNHGVFGLSIDGRRSNLSIPHSNDFQTVGTGGIADGNITTAAFVIELRSGSNADADVQPMQIRNCSVTVAGVEEPEVTEAIEPTPQATGELLANSSFDLVDTDGYPQDWSNPCGGEWQPASDGKEFSIGAGSCASQSLSTANITALNNGGEYSLSCEVLKTENHGTFGLTIDGVDSFLSIPTSNSYQTVTTGGTANDITTAAVVLELRNGTNAPSTVQPMQVRNCSLTVTGTEVTQGESQNNYLLNGGFEDLAANGKPQYWDKGCGGKWDVITEANAGHSVQLNGGACVNQFVSEPFATEASGNEITLSCNAKNSSGYADLTLFVDGVEHKTTVPSSGDAEQVSVTVAAQSFKNVLVALYGEGDVSFDNCSLTAANTNNNGNNSTPDNTDNGVWSEWLNRDGPSGLGDYEERYNFTQVCESPLDFEARLTNDTGKVFRSAEEAPDNLLKFAADQGLVCRNEDQTSGNCSDYQVRFFCPKSG